jgi:hypothetical protein
MRDIHSNLPRSSTAWGREVDSAIKALQKDSITNQGSIRAAIRNCNHTRIRHVDNIYDYGWHYPEYFWSEEDDREYLESLDGKKIAISDQMYGIIATDNIVFNGLDLYRYRAGSIPGADYQSSVPNYGHKKYFCFTTNIVGNPDFWTVTDEAITFPREYQYRVRGSNRDFTLERVSDPGVYLEAKPGFFGFSKSPTHWSLWPSGPLPGGLYNEQEYLITDKDMRMYLSTGAGVQTCSTAPWLISCAVIGDERQNSLYDVSCGAACIIIDSLEDTHGSNV